jgi:hypothetical protein
MTTIQIPAAPHLPYPYKAHPWNAQAFLAELDRRYYAMEPWLEACHWRPVAAALMDPAARMPDHPWSQSPVINHHLQMAAQECAAHDVWNRHRVLFEIHPGLTEHLRTSDSDKFPPLVLANLPYPNPIIFLGKPVDLRDPSDKPIRLVGWYVTGKNGHGRYVDTSDPSAQSFHITALCEVLSDDLQTTTDWDYTRITLPVTGEDATVGELIASLMKNFRWDPTINNQQDRLRSEFMSTLLHVIVPHMLYLVSQTLESKPQPVTVPPVPRVNKWDRKQGGGKAARQLVGFTSGPSLAALTRWGDEEVQPGTPKGPQGTHRSPVAHVRRAHFHTYRTGPGRTERVVKWLAPIPINAGGSPQGTQAVKVR